MKQNVEANVNLSFKILSTLADTHCIISGNFLNVWILQILFKQFLQFFVNFHLSIYFWGKNGEIVLDELKAIIYFNFAPFVIAGVMYINFDSLPVNFNILYIRNCSWNVNTSKNFPSRLFVTSSFLWTCNKDIFRYRFFMGLTVTK